MTVTINGSCGIGESKSAFVQKVLAEWRDQLVDNLPV
jgi:hypothetical protein